MRPLASTHFRLVVVAPLTRAVVLLLVLLLAAAPVHAGDTFEDHIERAVASYDEGDYEAALRHFEAAYGLDARSELLYNMGRSAEMLARFEVAIDYYARFVRSPGVAHEPRTDALARIEAWQATLALTGGGGGGGSTSGRIDINSASAAELENLPGIGPTKAAAIVAEREANGPFASVDDLTRVAGVGRGTIDKLRDHATAGRGGTSSAGSTTQGSASSGGGGPRVNVNTASAAELESLPGIGPAKAAAIVAEREANGPFASCQALTRVQGIGARTVEKLAAQCRTE